MLSIYPHTLSLLSISFLAFSINAESTTTATVLIPDWCITQSAPTVTASIIPSDLTVYSYKCSTNTAAIASAQAKASADAASAQAKASALRASLENIPHPTNKGKDDDELPPDARILENINWKRDDCFGLGAFDACIPWEVTQGPSYWAVRLSTGGVGQLQQECTLKPDGTATAAQCTASGKLDPKAWGEGEGPHTVNFAPADLDKYFIRNVVAVTAGGEPLQTGGSGNATTGTLGATMTGTVVGAEETGRGVANAIPGGAVAVLAGAGGILVAAVAL